MYRRSPIDVVREQPLQDGRILDDEVLQLVDLQHAPHQRDRHREAAQAPGAHAEAPTAEDTVERHAHERGAAGEQAVELGGGRVGVAEGELDEVGEGRGGGGGMLGEATIGEVGRGKRAAGEEGRREVQGLGGRPKDEFLEAFEGEGSEPGVEVGRGGAREEEVATGGVAAVGGEDVGDGGGGGGGGAEVGVEEVERGGKPESAPAAGEGGGARGGVEGEEGDDGCEEAVR